MDLSRQPIARMEALIKERLRIAFPARTFSIERVPQTMTLNEFVRLSRLSPFIGLAWTGMKPDGDAGRRLDGKMLWRLILIYKASNGFEARFKGDAKGLGLDAMVDVSLALLHGWTLPEIGRCAVTLANSVTADGFTDDAVVIAQVDFEIRFAAPVADYGLITLAALKELAVTWALDGSADTITDTISQEAP
ncbi:hypothetical protein H4S14_003598 [Agrobacterium vitis]|nr:hypothetical protein [Agrobacterium vitis]MBE1439830.1 hypothetical protein [Agrobacterium vitis]